jgi:hypothetical protein
MSAKDKKREKLSAVLIVLNEERTIARCLRSLEWCDEIIVVDGKSDDDTRVIVTDPSAGWARKIRWFEREWDGFRNQRNYPLKSQISSIVNQAKSLNKVSDISVYFQDFAQWWCFKACSNASKTHQTAGLIPETLKVA